MRLIITNNDPPAHPNTKKPWFLYWQLASWLGGSARVHHYRCQIMHHAPHPSAQAHFGLPGPKAGGLFISCHLLRCLFDFTRPTTTFSAALHKKCFLSYTSKLLCCKEYFNIISFRTKKSYRLSAYFEVGCLLFSVSAHVINAQCPEVWNQNLWQKHTKTGSCWMLFKLSKWTETGKKRPNDFYLRATGETLLPSTVWLRGSRNIPEISRYSESVSFE